MLYGLDLFTGIGGLTIALEEWVKPFIYCEIDPYAQSVILSRVSEGLLPSAPIWDDVRTLTKFHCPEIDIIYGGFPCQDISVAGTGKGLAGERSGLFFEILRLSEEIKPPFIFLENVPAITTRGGLSIVRAIASLGYDCRWCIISANSVGAPHKRDRWFLLAHANSARLQTERPEQQAAGIEQRDPLANSSSEGLPQRQGEKREWSYSTITGSGWWAIEPDVGRVAHGVPLRVDRIKCLGNSVVPEQAKTAFKTLMGIVEI